MFQKRAFERQASALAGERAGASYYAVARYDQPDGVGAVRGAHRARGLRKADSLGDCAIAGGSTERNFHQRFPDLLVKIRAFHFALEHKFLALAGIILGDLLLHLFQGLVVALGERIDMLRTL